jgi:hypothetical protein
MMLICWGKLQSGSGCIVFLNQGPICWINKKQSYIASSTIESKYIVTCVIVKETIWFHSLLNEIDYSQEGLHLFITIINLQFNL